MCGIFGGIGKNLNPGVIRALAIINRVRGTDSLGFFSNTGKCVKRVGDPLVCLRDDDFTCFIPKSCGKGWFLAGHTRRATSGRVTTRNAHPFRYGRIIGCHNGCVTLPAGSNYQVTSEYLLDRLNQEGDYQKAFADIKGWWGLTWFDGEAFYLQAHDNTICIGRDSFNNWYYSSEWKHLEACTGPLHNIAIISEGATIRFTLKNQMYERQPTFVSTTFVSTAGEAPKRVQKHRKKRYDVCDDWSRAADWEAYRENV